MLIRGSTVFRQPLHFRTAIAAMHFNENVNREQATTSEGDLRYAVGFTKAKKGTPSVKGVKPAATFGKSLSKWHMKHEVMFPTVYTSVQSSNSCTHTFAN